MAVDFAPKVKQIEGQPVIGSTQGEQSMAKLFEGVGKAVSGAVNFLDESVKEDIQDEAMNLFQEANAPFDPTGLPGDFSKTQNRMASLQKAWEQGKISDTQYYGHLTAGTKRLKNKFPGYGREVDAIIQGVTGVRPANALRNSILKELESQRVSANRRESDWMDFLEKQNTQKALGEAYPDVFTNPEKYSSDEKRAEVRAHVQKYNGKIGEFELIQKSLATDEATFKANERVIKQKTNQHVGFRVRESIAGLSKTVEGQYGVNLYTTLNKLSSGEIQLDPMELQQLIGTIRIRRDSLAGQLQEEILSNTNGFMDVTEIKSQVDAAMGPYDDILSAMQAGNWDIAGMHARTVKNIQERDLYTILKSSEDIRLFKTLKDEFPDLYEEFKTLEGAERFTETGRTIGTIQLDNINHTDMTLEDLLRDTLNSQDITTKEKSEGVRFAISSLSTQLSDPKANPEKWASLVEKVYSGNDVFDLISDNSHIDTFKKLTNPRITERISASGNPQLINLYHQWTVRQLSSLSDIRQMASDVNGIQTTGKYLAADVTPDGKISVMIDDEAFLEDMRDSGLRKSTNTMAEIQSALRSIEAWNQIFPQVVPIIEATGRDPQQDISQIMSNLAIDLDVRDGSFLSKVYDFFDATDTDTEDALNGMTMLQDFLARHPELLRSNQMQGPAQQGATGDASDILDMIGEAEGANYDTVYGYNEKRYGWNITDMTIGEVQKAQKQLAKDTGSSAFGKYQIMQYTLRDAINAMGLSKDEKFTPEMQDRIAREFLLKRRGYDRWKSGKMSDKAFLQELAKEWASIPTASGASFYAGDSIGNKATGAGRRLRQALLNQ